MSDNPNQKNLISIVGLIFLAQTNLLSPALAISWPLSDNFYQTTTQEKIVTINDTNNEIKVIDVSEDVIINVSEKAIEEKVKAEEKKPTREEIKEYVLNEVKRAGLNPYEAERIIHCESTWNPEAKNINRNGSNDLGLWQINSIHRKNISDAERLDYKASTKWAIEKRLRDGSWSAWVCAKKLAIR